MKGRVITLEYDDFYFVTVYTPNSQSALARLDYRMRWEDDFRDYLKKLDEHKPVIMTGDFNVAHQEIDLKNPKTNKKNAGFSRKKEINLQSFYRQDLWIAFVTSLQASEHTPGGPIGFKAREKDAGWRIDYFVVSDRVKEKMTDAQIYKTVMGSNSCRWR